MPVTYTASDQLAVPRAVHAGVNSVRAAYNSSTCLSVSDILFLAKIPNGATIIDGYLSGTIDSAGSTVKVGIVSAGSSSADNNLLTAVTLSTTSVLQRFNAGTLPVRVSLSDDATLQWAWAFMTVITAASITATSSLQFVINYVMRQGPGNTM